MSLLTLDDIEAGINVDLSDPNGEEITTNLIEAVEAWAETEIGYPLASGSQTAYFDGESAVLFLPTAAPVSSVALSLYNSSTRVYDAISSDYIRNSGNSQVYVTYGLTPGFQSVKATYTTGWSTETLPADLKQALIQLVGLKLQEVTNFSSNPDDPTGDGSGATAGALKKVSSGSYSEEYAPTNNEAAWRGKAALLARTIGDSVPLEIMATINRYRRAWAI